MDRATVDKFSRNLVRALLRHLEGRLTLHAATFATDAGAIACLGAGGFGKSTLAAAACRRDGVRLLGDDTAPIDLAGTPSVAPTEHVTWLFTDDVEAVRKRGVHARLRKEPVPAPRAAREPVPLVALVALSFDERLTEPTVTRVTGRRSFEHVSLAAVRFVIDEREVVLHDFDQISSLVARVPVYELARPRDLGQLDASVDALFMLPEARRAGEV
jgi:hypothetical protein